MVEKKIIRQRLCYVIINAFFPEECENKNMYEDWDICQELTDEECNSPFPEERDMFREFCPKKCGVCSKYSTYIRRALFKLRPSHLVVA